MADTDPRLGQLLDGRYRLESVLGEGTMGRVYVAEQVAMRRKVAVKLLLPEAVEDEASVARFRREVDAVTRLRSPHCITFFDFGTVGTELYIVMELLDGETLRQRLARGPLSILEARALGAATCACLAEAHAAGVLHRDLKPENLFLCRPPSEKATTHLKVLDFGLAKLVAPDDRNAGVLTRPRSVVGTPAYLAPEMARGAEPDANVDLYALGVILFEALTGARPFDAPNPTKMMLAHLLEPVPSALAHRPDLPGGIDAFFTVALAKERAERFEDATRLGSAFDAVLAAGARTT
jgi:serine/threonine-protein kinase